MELTQTSWVDELPQILWSYHTIPHSSTNEPLFTLAYGANAMIPIEIIEPTFQVDVFNEEVVDANQKAGLDVAEEI